MMNNKKLQREPINPVYVMKDGKRYDPHEVFSLEKPFTIHVGKYTEEIGIFDKPVYFKRKQLRVFGINMKLTNIKYAVGYEENDIKYFTFYDCNGKRISDIKEEVN